jgi:hypothetical protein
VQLTDVTTPVPHLSGLDEPAELGSTRRICTMLPLIVDPDFVTVLVTITPMGDSMEEGEGALLPGFALQLPPQKSSALDA